VEIKYLKINGFGKMENREINLDSNLNLIYGKNESGKTTLLRFITSMFYGLSKNKNGKEIADFDRYTPWNQGEFSGKIGYTLDNGKVFEVFRDFNKKNTQIYNEKKEDISKAFNIDKARGNEFFYEQTKVDETLLYTTSIVEQQKVVLDDSEQNILTQKIANLLSTGDDRVSYKKSIDKLNKKLIEEVGTERTVGRPINVINEQISDISKELELLDGYMDTASEIEKKKEELSAGVKNKEILLEIIKEIKRVKEEISLEEEKIKVQTNIKEEYNEKINSLNNKLKINDNVEKSSDNKSDKFSLIIIPILIILNILVNFIEVNKWLNYGIILGTVIYLTFVFTVFMKNKNKVKKININNQAERLEIKKELNILEENKLSIEKEINKLQGVLDGKLKEADILIKNKYKNDIPQDEINELFNDSVEELRNRLNIETNTYTDMKVEINTIEAESKEIMSKLELKPKYVEELERLHEQKTEALKLEKAINIAASALEEAYNKMKDTITPKFTKELSTIVEHISDGKYKNVRFTDEEGLRVEKENGEYIDAGLLSLGTIDQLYLSLRLSALSEISEEKMPIILDESFVYYDEERLENILRYMVETYQKHQIIILTCSEREQKALKSLGIPYNFIEI